MIPIVFRIPGLGMDIPGYGLMLMIGFLLSIAWAARRAERSGGNPDVVLNCGFIALLGGVIGARTMYVIHYWNEQFAPRGSTGQIVRAVLDVRGGGLEVYGGLIAVVVLVFLYLWLGKYSIRWYLDIVAPSTALGMAIGRIGCLLNGCCFGGVCDLPWAVRFPYGSPAQLQQWTEGRAGAGLPQELLIFADDGITIDGTAANPLPREIVTTPTREIEATHTAFAEYRARVSDLRAKLAQATDPGEKQRLQANITTLERQELPALLSGGCRTPPVLSGRQMDKYGLSATELRDLAQKYRSLRVHPTQVYSAITLGLLAALLSAVYWRRTRDGQVICTLLLIEPITRVFLEILRADNPEDVTIPWLPVPLTISQFLAICLSLVGLIGLLVLRNQPPRSPRAILWEPPPEPASRKKNARGARA